jgi:hypothetical protein
VHKNGVRCAVRGDEQTGRGYRGGGGGKGAEHPGSCTAAAAAAAAAQCRPNQQVNLS